MMGVTAGNKKLGKETKKKNYKQKKPHTITKKYLLFHK